MIAALLGKLLGLSAAGSVLNNIGGAVNHAASFGVITYCVTHANDEIKFTTSLGFLALIVAVGWLILELFRRSTPNRWTGNGQ